MKQKPEEVRIVIGQRGWVWVGFYTKSASEVVLRKAKSIRRWGADKGLGQLCKGIREATMLDEAGTVRLHELAVVATYDADTASWAKVLK